MNKKKYILFLLTGTLSVSFLSAAPVSADTLIPVAVASSEGPSGEDPSADKTEAVYAAYLSDLQSRQDGVRQYNWQMADGEFHYPAGSEPGALKPVALTDICGDSTPELIYLYTKDGFVADLRIIGPENDTAAELCDFPQWDVCAASGTSFALFQTAGDKTLYACSYIGDEIGFHSWYCFREQDGVLKADKIASADIHYADYDDKPDEYTVNGESADQGTYDSFTGDLIGRAETTVLYSAHPDMNAGYARLFELSSSGMSYDDAVRSLQDLSGSSPVLVNPAEGGQYLPESSDRLLTDSDLTGLSSEQIQTAVNEIYARHGYVFKDPKILEYFEQYDWYSEQNTDMDAVAGQLSETEMANVKFLISHI